MAPSGPALAQASDAPAAASPVATPTGGSPSASPFDYSKLQWIPGDPSDPPPTPTPEPSPTPTPTPRSSLVPGSGIPASAWRVPVLMYHLIESPVPAGAASSLVVSPTLFDAHMRGLHDAGWATITAAQLNAALSAGARPPRQTVVITFDDGHVDGYTNARPILQRYGFVGTFYVVTNRFGWSGYLTADQARAMAAQGMEIANHTMDHADLAASSQARAQAQITGAQDAIEAVLGVRPATLAYPFGSYSSTAIRLVSQAGLGIAVTTVSGCAIWTGNRLTVPRIRVSPGMSTRDLLTSLMPCTG